MLDKRPRLTENQVAHGILSARYASRLGSSPRLNASVDLEAGSAAKHSADTGHVGAGWRPVGVESGTHRVGGSFPLPHHKKHTGRSGAEHQVSGKYGWISRWQ
jgi:hypothetical protein